MNPSTPTPTGVSAGTGEQQPASAPSGKRPLRGSEVAYAIFTAAVAILFFATAL